MKKNQINSFLFTFNVFFCFKQQLKQCILKNVNHVTILIHPGLKAILKYGWKCKAYVIFYLFIFFHVIWTKLFFSKLGEVI